jgi:hypothetical protein
MRYEEQHHPPGIGTILMWMTLLTTAAILVAIKSCT